MSSRLATFRLSLAVAALAGSVHAQVTERMSVSSSGREGNSGAWTIPGNSISDDGRFVAFQSISNNLVPNDTNASWDIFVRDRLTRTTTRASVSSTGEQGNWFSGVYGLCMSSDGRIVAFESRATNLVPGDTNGAADIFLHDIQTGTTERVSVDSMGNQANGSSAYPSLSADARFVAFTSNASNLVPGDTNAAPDTFVHDRVTGTTERVSVTTSGAQADLGGYTPVISADGRYVAFESNATNLVPGDTNGSWDVFVHDRQSGTTERVSASTNGLQGDGDSWSARISADGRYVAFSSRATTLVPGDTNGFLDAFVHDRRTGTTERVSVGPNGVQGDFDSAADSVSVDGRYVAFTSGATNMVAGDANGTGDVFLHDRLTGTNEIVSLSIDGTQGNGLSGGAHISGDARYVAFGSDATNLVPGDANANRDIFVRDRLASGFVSLCDPGVGSVAPCPCSNPPSSPGRGCDNSSSTGGAVLSAAGIAYLATDSLTFTTNAETPTALSMVLQGKASVPGGVVYGRGIRCLGGSLARLYSKHAVAGSITAPDFVAGDPPVSERSAALGDRIHPGESRWYVVYYRDRSILGGCPASSTFNVTQTGMVTWWP